MDAGCDKDLLVVATASVGFLVMATSQSRFMPGIVLKLDNNNAFNSLHCDFMLTAVKNHLPHLHNYVELCYAEPSVSAMIIMSVEGAPRTARRFARIYTIMLGNSTNCRQTVV